MEILRTPTISCCIINPLECSSRILVSYEFEDHHAMDWSPKSFRGSKIFWGIVIQIRSRQDNLRNRYFRNFLRFQFFWSSWLFARFSCQLLLLSNITLLFWNSHKKFLIFFIRFFEFLSKISDLAILLLDLARETINLVRRSTYLIRYAI